MLTNCLDSFRGQLSLIKNIMMRDERDGKSVHRPAMATVNELLHKIGETLPPSRTNEFELSLSPSLPLLSRTSLELGLAFI